MVLRTAVIEAVAVLPRRHGAFIARRVVAGRHGRDVQAGPAIVSVDAFKVVRWPAQPDADARAEEDAVLNLVVWAVEGQPDVAPLVAQRLAALRVRAAAPGPRKAETVRLGRPPAGTKNGRLARRITQPFA